MNFHVVSLEKKFWKNTLSTQSKVICLFQFSVKVEGCAINCAGGVGILLPFLPSPREFHSSLWISIGTRPSSNWKAEEEEEWGGISSHPWNTTPKFIWDLKLYILLKTLNSDSRGGERESFSSTLRKLVTTFMDLGNGNTFRVLNRAPDSQNSKKSQHFGSRTLIWFPLETFLHYSKKPKKR